jgi:hypothetical protein
VTCSRAGGGAGTPHYYLHVATRVWRDVLNLGGFASTGCALVDGGSDSGGKKKRRRVRTERDAQQVSVEDYVRNASQVQHSVAGFIPMTKAACGATSLSSPLAVPH